MYRHTVVFSLHAAPGSTDEARFLADAEAALSTIPGLGDFAISRQVSPKSELTWQFAMTFADEEAFAAYNAHPSHVAFVESRWVPEVAAFQEYDFLPASAKTE